MEFLRIILILAGLLFVVGYVPWYFMKDGVGSPPSKEDHAELGQICLGFIKWFCILFILSLIFAAIKH